MALRSKAIRAGSHLFLEKPIFLDGENRSVFVPRREASMDSRNQADAAREAEIDTVLAEFGGDARLAIGSLLSDLDVLARDREASVSYGFTRGMIRVYERKHCASQGKVDGDYKVEAWDDRGRIVAVVAHCDSVTVARAAYEATLPRYPKHEVTLRQGCRVIARHAPPQMAQRG